MRKETKTYQFFVQTALMLLTMVLTSATAWADSTFSGGDGTEDNPYQIATYDDLDQLAADVKGGNSYSGKYFKMTADITYTSTTVWNNATSTENNYTAIGNYNNRHPFSGTFDGDGHTVSGIRIYKSSANLSDGIQGLFGYVKNGTVKNVTLANARITAPNGVGGIAGLAFADGGSSTIENCHVQSNVAIHAVVNCNSHGGIAGSNNKASVFLCTSAATLTIASGAESCSVFGGIVGNCGGPLYLNYAVGVKVASVDWGGAICGQIYDINDCEYNYYNSDCAVGGSSSGIGYGGTYSTSTLADLPTDTENSSNHPDGAVPGTLTILNGTEDVPTTLSGKVAFHREFAGGKSSTICLPFAYTPAAGIGTFYEFGGVNDEKTEVTMTATTDNPLQANKPYLFVPTAGGVVFHGDAASSISAGSTTKDHWQFVGTYTTVEWPTDPLNIYGFASGEAYGGATDDTAAGTFIRVHTGGIRPMRAYLQYTGGSEARTLTRGAADTLPETMTVRLVNNIGQTTGISELRIENLELRDSQDVWFDLSGRRLNGKPTAKGVYIHNGRKEIINNKIIN